MFTGSELMGFLIQDQISVNIKLLPIPVEEGLEMFSTSYFICHSIAIKQKTVSERFVEFLFHKCPVAANKCENTCI